MAFEDIEVVQEEVQLQPRTRTTVSFAEEEEDSVSSDDGGRAGGWTVPGTRRRSSGSVSNEEEVEDGAAKVGFGTRVFVSCSADWGWSVHAIIIVV